MGTAKGNGVFERPLWSKTEKERTDDEVFVGPFFRSTTPNPAAAKATADEQAVDEADVSEEDVSEEEKKKRLVKTSGGSAGQEVGAVLSNNTRGSLLGN